jgi:hypothetical protein
LGHTQTKTSVLVAELPDFFGLVVPMEGWMDGPRWVPHVARNGSKTSLPQSQAGDGWMPRSRFKFPNGVLEVSQTPHVIVNGEPNSNRQPPSNMSFYYFLIVDVMRTETE